MLTCPQRNIQISRIFIYYQYCLVCGMNVHKRCMGKVANTCGINPRLMADILKDMGMSVKQFDEKPKKPKKTHAIAGDSSQAGSESDAELAAKLEDLKIVAQLEMDKKMQERLANAPKSVKDRSGGEKDKGSGMTSLQEMVEKQAGTHKSVLEDFR